MQIEELSLPGLLLLTPDVFSDERGFFLERYNRRAFQDRGIILDFVQDNHSQSVRDVLRGLHFQIPPFAQDKLVWVMRGKAFDVAVDIRPDSPTYGRWSGVVLSEENRQMFLIPQGFAHGFVALSDTLDFCYKTTNYYSRDHDCGLLWNDPDIGIEWPVHTPALSEKDRHHPRLRDLEQTRWE